MVLITYIIACRVSVRIHGDSILIGAEHGHGIEPNSGCAYVTSISEGDNAEKRIKPKWGLSKEKDEFFLVLTVVPLALVLLPLIVYSSVVYTQNKVLSGSYSRVKEDEHSTRGVRSNSASLRNEPGFNEYVSGCCVYE
jgi:hypothetical protein